MHRALPPFGRQLTRLALSLVVIALAAPAAAVKITFEELGENLPIKDPSTGGLQFFYNGSSAARVGQPTNFTSHTATFSNQFTNFGGGCCWQGWADSQTTDTTTPGFVNQYSAIAGSGAFGSRTYGVAFTGGQVGAQADVSRITFAAPVSLKGAYFTNTTYAALSMRDGDSFAKKFGGPSGNDPDYFILTITGRDSQNAVTGSVEFALADYRFADPALDYIVSNWTFVDLSSLGEVAALEFSLDSSDQSFGFLNTPSYFAMDNLTFTHDPSVVKDEIAEHRALAASKRAEAETEDRAADELESALDSNDGDE